MIAARAARTVQKCGMAATPSRQPQITAQMPESSVARLYSAAVGTVGSAYYQAVFGRFEVAGRARLSWNWAAGLLTLNWLLFRKLWLAALAYWLALLGLPVLILGLGRLVFQLPMSIEAGLWLSCAVLSLAVPGAWGNAWLHAACKQRIAKALATTPTLDEACQQLQQSASTKKQAIGLGLANLALLCALALAYTWFSGGSTQEDDEELAAAVTNLPAPVKLRLAPPVQAPIQEPLSPSSQAASIADAATSSASPVAVTASSPATAASAPADPVSATASAPVIASAATQAQSTVKTTASASVPPLVPASAPAATRAPASQTRPASKPSPAAAKASRAETAKSTPVKPSKASSSPSTKEVFVNVGLFADPDNARNAYVKLVKAGLPAGREVIWPPEGSTKSKLTRVRAGPFANRAQAQAAVAKIKALQLDAVMAP